MNRAKKILYTDPEGFFYQTLLIDSVWLAQNTKGFQKINPEKFINNPDCSLGILGKSSYEEWSTLLFPNTHVIKYSNTEELYKALVDKKINAVFLDDLSIKLFLLNNPRMILHYSAIILKNRPDFISIGVSQENWQLWYWLNQYIEIKNEPMTADKLLQKYYNNY